MKKILILVAAIAVLYAALPLFGRNYIPTHDGEYHIIRIVEFSRMISEGYLFPRWAPDMNSGFGIPIFNYHYPLPNYIGAFVRTVTKDAVYAFQASQGLGYIFLFVGVFLWLTALFGFTAGLVGSVVAAFVPYVFVDIYVRGTIGEIWAIAILFWILWLTEKHRHVWFAVFYGLLILSHNILALLFTPFIAGYLFIRDKRSLPWMLGGLGLSAYFWIPALAESRFVQGLNTVNFREHFVQVYELLVPSWGTEFSATGSMGNKISFQLGIVPIIVFLGGLWASRKDRKQKPLTIYFASVLVLCVFFMLPVSAPLWQLIRPLQLMQYPWRLLSFVVPISGFFAAYWVSKMNHLWVGYLIAAVAVLLSASYARPVLYAPRNEAYYMSRSNFTDGTSSMGNSFSTVWTGWKETRLNMPYSGRYLDRIYRVKESGPSDVTIPILYFPGWHVAVDGTEAAISYKKDGVIHVPVPAGDHLIRTYFTETPVRMGADAISVASLVILVALGILAL